MEDSLKKVVLITGCNGAIGRQIVSDFSALSYTIICCVRKKDQAFSDFIVSLSNKNPKTEIFVSYFDLSDENQIKEELRNICTQHKRIDVLVNNAGVAVGGLLQMTSMKLLKEVFQINFFSQVLITQIISRKMMRSKCGSIINLGSVAGIDNFGGYTSYGSSKAAIMFFSKTISKELAPYNIRVNAIAPGLVDTTMGRKMEKKASAEMIDRTSMKRFAKPVEISSLVLFLASDKASFITGQTYRIDGGM